MKKITMIATVILGMNSMAHAAKQWYMTCNITEITEARSITYKVNAASDALKVTTGSQQARLVSPLSFEAFMKEKTAPDTLTPWMKVGDRQVVINVAYQGVPLSNIVGKDDALSITRAGGKKLMIGCFTFKK